MEAASFGSPGASSATKAIRTRLSGPRLAQGPQEAGLVHASQASHWALKKTQIAASQANQLQPFGLYFVATAVVAHTKPPAVVIAPLVASTAASE